MILCVCNIHYIRYEIIHMYGQICIQIQSQASIKHFKARKSKKNSVRFQLFQCVCFSDLFIALNQFIEPELLAVTSIFCDKQKNSYSIFFQNLNCLTLKNASNDCEELGRQNLNVLLEFKKNITQSTENMSHIIKRNNHIVYAHKCECFRIYNNHANV